MAGLAILVMSSCGSSEGGSSAASPAASAPASSPERVSVVASTNVYGDIVQQIGGDRVDVVSIISDPSQDPHSFEANAQTQLRLSTAKIVVENGGGYDDFVDTMLKAAANPGVQVLNAVTVSGKTAKAGETLNEHIWYDFPSVGKLADELAAALGKADSAGAAQFTANASAFKAKLQALETAEAEVAATAKGQGVAITEPVPLYLLAACGLVDRTPAEFSEAVEEGGEIPPRALRETLALLTGKQVAALVYNEQTAGPETEQVRQAAQKGGVAIVPVTETLPSGKDYIGWMTDNVAAVRNAVSR
ncbi:ABC transporter substrate-binding protein [Sphaerisporangium album]|uniref:ABC transporter substrate-binding protein n=2 Tax=Sphaerisporangium album TaxID=509200 RepID=A0A367FJB1_9ACTN|nr:ABC transporter substrate-binding protein [Sphaerisporangium album]